MKVKQNLRVFSYRVFSAFLVFVFFFILISDILLSPVYAENSDSTVSVDSNLVFEDLEVTSVSVDGEASVASVDSSDFSITAAAPSTSSDVAAWTYRYDGMTPADSIDSEVTYCSEKWESIFNTTQSITLSYNGDDALYCSYVDVDCYLYYSFIIQEYVSIVISTEGFNDLFVGFGYVFATDYIDVNYFCLGTDYAEDFETVIYSSVYSNGSNWLISDTTSTFEFSALGSKNSTSLYLGDDGDRTRFRIAVPITLRFYNSDTSSSFYVETHDSNLTFSLSHNTKACFTGTAVEYFGNIDFYISNVTISLFILYRYSPYISVVGYSYVEDYTSMYNALSSYVESTYTMVVELQTAVAALGSDDVDLSTIESYLSSIISLLEASSDVDTSEIEYYLLCITEMLSDYLHYIEDDLVDISSYVENVVELMEDILSSDKSILSKLTTITNLVDTACSCLLCIVTFFSYFSDPVIYAYLADYFGVESFEEFFYFYGDFTEDNSSLLLLMMYNSLAFSSVDWSAWAGDTAAILEALENLSIQVDLSGLSVEFIDYTDILNQLYDLLSDVDDISDEQLYYLEEIFSCLGDYTAVISHISASSAETASTSVEILDSVNLILSKLDSLDDIVALLNELIDKLDELELDLSIVDDDSVYQETLQEFSDIVNEYADYEGDVNELLLDLSVSLDDFSVSVAIDSNISAGSESLNSWFDLFMQIPLLSSLVVCSLTVSVVFVFIRRKGDSV